MKQRDRWMALATLAVLAGTACLVAYWCFVWSRGLSFGFY